MMLARCDAIASTASRLHVRDDRDTPLSSRRDGKMKPSIWGGWKAEYFSSADWTTQINLRSLTKFDFASDAFSRPTGRESGRFCDK
jgi:hypothetical protein